MCETFQVVFGSIEPRVSYKFEDGRRVAYSYAIHRDRAGVETNKTEPVKLSSIGWSDGTPFTQSDVDGLI